jgi:hypothetical protein
MILLKLNGWEQSWGIKAYLDICEKEKIPVYELLPENLESQIVAFKEKMSKEKDKIDSADTLRARL